jgi:hypothetical protein
MAVAADARGDVALALERARAARALGDEGMLEDDWVRARLSA